MPPDDFRSWSEDLNADDPREESGEPSSGVEEILAASGLNDLESGVSVDSLDQPLRTLSTSAKEAELDALSFQLLAEAAKRKLKELGVSSYGSLVDTCLEDARMSHYSGVEETDATSPIEETEPWDEAVPGEPLVQELVRTIERYVALSPAAALTTAVWILFAHAHDAFVVSPLLAVVSPTKRCGKTTLLTVVSLLVPRSLLASNISTAALFRAVDAYAPTLLIDEADTFLDDNEGLRGVLNSGHAKYAASVVRAVALGDDYDIRKFSTWSPKCVARIGQLKSTLHDRALEIRLRRKLPGDQVQPLRLDHVEESLPLRRRCVRWADDHREELHDSDPIVPTGLTDRAADNWRPLLSIAEKIGGDLPERLRAAARELSSGAQEDDEVRTLLLSDMRELFGEKDRVRSKDVVSQLVELEHRRWPEYRRGQPITPPQVAALLRSFGVKPTKIRFGQSTARGYRAEDLEAVFKRYLPPVGSEQTEQPGIETDSRDSRDRNTEEIVPTERSGVESAPIMDVPDVPF